MKADAVDLVWDLFRERLTIGGALVLRQEGEMLARIQGRSALAVHLVSQESDRRAAERLAQTIFGASILPFHLIRSPEAIHGWPQVDVRSQSDFSHFSFSRTIALYAESGLKPRLQWSKLQQDQAEQVRKQFRVD